MALTYSSTRLATSAGDMDRRSRIVYRPGLVAGAWQTAAVNCSADRPTSAGRQGRPCRRRQDDIAAAWAALPRRCVQNSAPSPASHGELADPGYNWLIACMISWSPPLAGRLDPA